MSADVVLVDAIRVEDRAQTHSVYGAIDAAGDTLYVGCTNDIARRVAEHRRTSPWWQFVARIDVVHETRDRAEALRMERAVIRSSKPEFNQAHGNPSYAREVITLSRFGITAKQYISGVAS